MIPWPRAISTLGVIGDAFFGNKRPHYFMPNRPFYYAILTIKSTVTKDGAVNALGGYLQFASRHDFRGWLEKNYALDSGVWLLFGKAGGPKTIAANEALEEALCFGWIDGQMQRIDDKTYRKYFSARRENSKWSEKNKVIVEALEKRGIMTGHGRAKIAEAKKNGQWDKPKAPPVTDEQIAVLADLLKGHEPACINFEAMSPSVKKTYTRAYLDAKTDAGRAARIAWIIERLDKNLKPM